MANNSVWQYEQPRCPDGWNESERRFYTRLIEVLDDIYSKYGRIGEKMLAKQVIEKIETSTEAAFEKMTADVISSGTIAADTLQAAFAYMVSLSARYGEFGFADIKNLMADAMLLEKGTAGELRINNLKVDQTQIADLIVGSFRLVSQDGKVYKVNIDAEGNLNTEYLYDQEDWLENGEIPDGYSAVAGELTVGEVTAGNLYVSGAAEIMKLTAKWLSADEAWINELNVGLVKSRLGEQLNLQSNSAIVGMVGDISGVASQLEQTAEALEISLSKKVGEDTLKQYLRYEDGTVEMGSSESRYKLQANNTGVTILQDGQVMTRMQQNAVVAPVIEAERMLKIGTHTAKVSASGALVFN